MHHCINFVARLLLNRFYEMKKTGGKTKVSAHPLAGLCLLFIYKVYQPIYVYLHEYNPGNSIIIWMSSLQCVILEYYDIVCR